MIRLRAKIEGADVFIDEWTGLFKCGEAKAYTMAGLIRLCSPLVHVPIRMSFVEWAYDADEVVFSELRYCFSEDMSRHCYEFNVNEGHCIAGYLLEHSPHYGLHMPFRINTMADGRDGSYSLGMWMSVDDERYIPAISGIRNTLSNRHLAKKLMYNLAGLPGEY